MKTPLNESIVNVQIDEPTTADGLQVFGLRWNEVDPLDYLTLDEALEHDSFKVTELSESGSVPTLLVHNDTDRRVFLMAGEELIGAKQNRVLNVSILVAGHTQTKIPVSCVEMGRWGYRGRKFGSHGTSSHATLRKKMSHDAREGYIEVNAPVSKQREVWQMIDAKLGRMRSSSPSGALHQAYADHRKNLDGIVDQVRVDDACNGALFAFGGAVAGLDLFDQPATLTKLLPKLVRSYALDAMEQRSEATVDRHAVQAWLETATSARCQPFKSPGLGQDVRLESKTLVGAGLIVDDHPVHVELFAEDLDNATANPPK